MNVPGPGVFFEGAALGVTFFSSSMEIGWMGSTYLYEDQLQFSKKKKKKWLFYQDFQMYLLTVVQSSYTFFLFWLFIILCICVFSILSGSFKTLLVFPS